MFLPKQKQWKIGIHSYISSDKLGLRQSCQWAMIPLRALLSEFVLPVCVPIAISVLEVKKLGIPKISFNSFYLVNYCITIIIDAISRILFDRFVTNLGLRTNTCKHSHRPVLPMRTICKCFFPKGWNVCDATSSAKAWKNKVLQVFVLFLFGCAVSTWNVRLMNAAGLEQ